MSSQKQRRSNKGNMLILTGTCSCVISIGVILAGSFAGLAMSFNRLQTSADELALAGARKVNENDRSGQMNNMIARSRQLVFLSREQHDKTQAQMHNLDFLSEQLLEESRDGAAFLENERKTLRALNQQEAVEAINHKYEQLKNSHSLVLPWLRVQPPLTPVVKFGYISDVQSNVGELKAFEMLESHDESNSVVQDHSDLYKKNINAKLPGADGDLHFKLSSLPAPVDGNVPPARCTLAQVFRNDLDDQLQSAVQVELKLDVETMLGASAGSQLKSIGTACATGGAPQM